MAERAPTNEPLPSSERVNTKEFTAVYGRIALSFKTGDNKIFDKNKHDIPTVSKDRIETNLETQRFDAADNASTRERREQAKDKTAEQWIDQHVSVFKQNFHNTQGFDEELVGRWESFVCSLFGVENQNQIDVEKVRGFYDTYCGEKTDTGAFVKKLLQIYGGDFRQIEANRDVIQWVSGAFGVEYSELEISFHHTLVEEQLQEKQVDGFIEEVNAVPTGEAHSRINSPSDDKEAPICDYLYKDGEPLEIKPGKPAPPPTGKEPPSAQTGEQIDLDRSKDMNLNVAVQVLGVLRDRNMWQDNGENYRHQYGFDISKDREWFHLITDPDAKNSGAMNDVAQNRYQLPIAVYMPGNHAMLVTKGPYKQGSDWYINVWNPFYSDTRPVKLQKNYDDKVRLEGNFIDDHLYVNRLFLDQQRDKPEENDLEALFNDPDVAPIREILRTAKLNELQQNAKDCIPLCMVTAAFLNALKKGDTPFKTKGIPQMLYDYHVQILTREAFSNRISVPKRGGAKEPIQIKNQTEHSTIEKKEFPQSEVVLIGESGDGMRFVLNPKVIEKANKDLLTRSYSDGTFREQKGHFFGKCYIAPSGEKWAYVFEYEPSETPGSTSGKLQTTYEEWAKTMDKLEEIRMKYNDKDIRIIGWGHTHPSGWSGKISNEDVDNHQKYYHTDEYVIRFIYVYGAGDGGRNTPTTLGTTLTNTHAFFSRGGAGGQYGLLRKHKGIYLGELDSSLISSPKPAR